MENRHDYFKRRLKEHGVYEPESDYEGLMGKWVEELSETFSKQGHSGTSAESTVCSTSYLRNGKAMRDFQKNVEGILITCGDPGRCKVFGADVWWLVTRKNKKAIPYNRWGEPHFADSPKADEFRKKKKPVKDDDLNVDGE